VTRRRRSHTGLVLAGVIVILAGFAIALVEAYKLPKGAIWVVVAGAVILVAAIRWLTRR
jgi:hypothetical protein